MSTLLNVCDDDCLNNFANNFSLIENDCMNDFICDNFDNDFDQMSVTDVCVLKNINEINYYNMDLLIL